MRRQRVTTWSLRLEVVAMPASADMSGNVCAVLHCGVRATSSRVFLRSLESCSAIGRAPVCAS